MHIAPRTGECCFQETAAGLLKVLMCDCITNAFYVMIIFVSGDSLDIKELTYAIVINFILYFERFWAHLLQTLVYIYVHKALHTGPRQGSACSLKVFLYID